MNDHLTIYLGRILYNRLSLSHSDIILYINWFIVVCGMDPIRRECSVSGTFLCYAAISYLLYFNIFMNTYYIIYNRKHTS